jgi:hypothetical protein
MDAIAIGWPIVGNGPPELDVRVPVLGFSWKTVAELSR